MVWLREFVFELVCMQPVGSDAGARHHASLFVFLLLCFCVSDTGDKGGASIYRDASYVVV